MKIGVVVYGSLEIISGGYLYDRKLVAYLRSCGDEVVVIGFRPGSYVSHLMDNLHVRLKGDLDILIEDELVHPSLLVANSLRPPIDATGRYPIISLIHNLRSSERRAAWQTAIYQTIEKRYLSTVHGFIFNSEATLASVKALVAVDKPYVIATPGGDRLGTLSLEAVQSRAAEGGALRLLFLANVTPLKGLHVVLDALGELPQGSCTLDVVGSLQVDPLYSNRMQGQAASISQPVTFHGVLDGRPLVKLLEQSQVLVLPSFYEGFGIAFVEGMAFGVPAIGTSVGAVPEVITDGENGYVIAPGDSAALAKILERLFSNRDLLARLSANALQRFSSFPTWNQSAEAIRTFLLEIMTSWCPRPN